MPLATNIPPTYEELDAEIARRQANMDLHINGLVIARDVRDHLLAIRRRWEAADLCGCPDHHAPVTMQERIRLSACADPAPSRVIAERLGILHQHAASDLSHWRRKGKGPIATASMGRPTKLARHNMISQPIPRRQSGPSRAGGLRPKSANSWLNAFLPPRVGRHQSAASGRRAR